MSDDRATGTPDERLYALAGAQHQLVTWEQARSCGLSSRALRSRIAAGRLLLHRAPCVYGLPGVADSRLRYVMGAVLAFGRNAFASHSTAAWLHGLPLPPDSDGELEVTVPLGRFGDSAGVWLHRSGLLGESDITTSFGVCVGSVERTIVDLSGRLDAGALRDLTEDALRRRVTSLGRIEGCIRRLGRAPGRSPKKVGAVLAACTPAGHERESVLEDFVFEAIGRFGLPLPRCQRRVTVAGRRYRLDMSYEDPMIAIEADGFDTHGRRAQFDRDRVRGNDVTLAGYTLLAFTSAFTDWQIAATVAQALGLDAPPEPASPLTFAAWQERRVCSPGRA